jgi:hypothetical protein
MAKKRQLNVRLPDALLSQLEERVQKTKMGMAAMVEVLLVQALQQQETSDSESVEGDRFESLVKRIEVLETKLAGQSEQSDNLPKTEVVPTIKSLPTAIESILTEVTIPDEVEAQPSDLTALNGEELANRLAVEVRTLKQKKDKGTFSDWTKKHDPNGVAWKYVSEEERFHPLADNLSA